MGRKQRSPGEQLVGGVVSVTLASSLLFSSRPDEPVEAPVHHAEHIPEPPPFQDRPLGANAYAIGSNAGATGPAGTYRLAWNRESTFSADAIIVGPDEPSDA